MKACEFWPRGSVPAAYYEPVSSSVPVLLMSGYAGPGGPVSAETDPNLAFLQKPFTPTALSDAVQQLLQAG